MQFFRFILIVLCLTGLLFTQKSLKDLQKKEQINSLGSEEQLPPSVTLITTALGPMKGLIANAIMWRAGELQDEKQHAEAAQLAGMITAIQPHYPSVWSWQAFNLSFNVASDFVSPEEKWPWILAGIELLRDKGLKYNPDDPSIRNDLLRIIMDKIEATEKNNLYMQEEWVRIMLPYFPTGTKEDLVKMSAAPISQKELLQDPIVLRLQKAATSRKIDLLDFKKNPPQISLAYAQYLMGILPDKEAEPKVLAAIEKIYWHHMRTKVEKGLSFDFKRSLWIEENYGPLDWRAHQTWAIYFGARKDFKEFRASGGVDHTNYMTGAMRSAFLLGRIIYNPVTDSFSRTYNVAMLPRLFEYYDALYAAKPDNARVKKSYRDFLQTAITVCYNANQMDAAKDLYYHFLQDGFGDDTVSFNHFILASMQKILKSSNSRKKRSFIESIIENAYTSASFGDYGRSQGLLNRARLIWNLHQQKHGATSAALPEWNNIVKGVRMRWLAKNKGDSKTLDANLEKAKESGSKDKRISAHPGGEFHE